MEQIKDEQMKKMLSELTGLLYQVYKDKLKVVILYGSVARGTQTKDSDIDIMVLVEENGTELRNYDEKLGEVSVDISLKYLKVFSIIDVSYEEYEKWKQIYPFYKNVSKEGVILYAA
jgi:predicted nucleotidyltransferase